jgi:hypothetical protein
VPYLTPIEIDPANQGTQPGTIGISGGNACTGPFIYSGNLYIVLVGLSDNSLHCLKSSDNGVTWSEVDAAHAPAVVIFQCAFDGTLITVAYKSGYPLSSPFDLRVIQFDCSSDLWGTAVTGGPDTNQVEQILYRASNSDYLILYYTGDAPHPRQHGVPWSVGGGFDSDFYTDTGFNGETGWAGDLAQVRACLDPDDACHMFFVYVSSLPSPSGENVVAYQRIASDNSLGATNSWRFSDGSNWSDYTPGLPAATADWVVLPHTYTDGATRGIPSIIVGAPISSPTWTPLTTSTGIDPHFGSISLESYPGAGSVLGGGKLYITYGDTEFQRVRICRTSNLTDPTMGWQSEDAFNGGGGSNVDSASTLPVLVSSAPQICFDDYDQEGNYNQVRYFTPWTAAPPGVTGGNTFGGAGGGFSGGFGNDFF